MWLEKLGNQRIPFETQHVSAAVLHRTAEINAEKGVPLTEKRRVLSTLQRDHGGERQEEERVQDVISHSIWTAKLGL